MADPWLLDQAGYEEGRAFTLLQPGTIVACETCDQCGSTELRVASHRDFPLAQLGGYIPLICDCGNRDLALGWEYVQQLKAGLGTAGIATSRTTIEERADALDSTEMLQAAASFDDPNQPVPERNRNMKRDDALPGRYLGQENFPKPCLAQVAHVVVEEIKGERGMERKPVLYIMGPSYDVDILRGIILNGTNWDALEEITGKDDSDEWKNAQIVVYVDPKVMFGSKRVGGIRIRAPKSKVPVEPEPEPELADDEIPF